MEHVKPLIDDMDAMRWAEEFLDRINDPDLPGADPQDLGFLGGWFANALETGRRAGQGLL